MVTVLMMSAKLAAPDLLKIKIWRNKGYGVINPDYYITSEILSLDPNVTKVYQSLVTLAFLWGKSS